MEVENDVVLGLGGGGGRKRRRWGVERGGVDEEAEENVGGGRVVEGVRSGWAGFGKWVRVRMGGSFGVGVDDDGGARAAGAAGGR